MNSERYVVMATEGADVIATIVIPQFQHAGKPKFTKAITCMASIKIERQVGISLVFFDNEVKLGKYFGGNCLYIPLLCASIILCLLKLI